MEFALSQDQTLFLDATQNFLANACPLDAVRQAVDGDVSARTAINNGLSELGIFQILVPGAYGGLGLGLLDAAIIQEQLGHVVSPVQLTASAMATICLLTAGSEDQKQIWLGKLAAGEVRFGVAMTERVGARQDAGVQAVDGKLSGNTLFALEAQNATHILVCDAGGRVHIVDAGAPGVEQKKLTLIDKTRDFIELVFNGAPAEPLVNETQIGLAADKAIEAGRILLAADTLGAAQAMIDKAVAYSLERKQFNRVIGSFQAVKHLCAEMAAEIEPARALVWHTAHTFDEGTDDASLMVCLAKSHLSEIGTFIARTATEVHGGMGFTDLLGLHYWFKRIGTNRQLLGSPERLRQEAAELQAWA